MFYKSNADSTKPFARIKYSINTRLIGTDCGAVRYEHNLIVRQPPVANREGAVSHNQAEITTCCCVNQGTSKWKTEFEKNIYTAKETARAIVSVDNSECNTWMNEISL